MNAQRSEFNFCSQYKRPGTKKTTLVIIVLEGRNRLIPMSSLANKPCLLTSYRPMENISQNTRQRTPEK